MILVEVAEIVRTTDKLSGSLPEKHSKRTTPLSTGTQKRLFGTLPLSSVRYTQGSEGFVATEAGAAARHLQTHRAAGRRPADELARLRADLSRTLRTEATAQA